MSRLCLAGAIEAGTLAFNAAAAGDVDWRVVVSSGIALPQLPSPDHSHYVQATARSDAGAGLVGFKLRQSNGRDGLWTERGSILAPYAQIAATGATGPGRSGADATHVFCAPDFYSDSFEGVRVFGGSTGSDRQQPVRLIEMRSMQPV